MQRQYESSRALSRHFNIFFNCCFFFFFYFFLFSDYTPYFLFFFPLYFCVVRATRIWCVFNLFTFFFVCARISIFQMFMHNAHTNILNSVVFLIFYTCFALRPFSSYFHFFATVDWSVNAVTDQSKNNIFSRIHKIDVSMRECAAFSRSLSLAHIFTWSPIAFNYLPWQRARLSFLANSHNLQTKSQLNEMINNYYRNNQQQQ